MGATYYLNDNANGRYASGADANNGYIRYNEPNDYYRVYIGQNLPANAYISAYNVQGGGSYYGWSEGYFKWTGRFYGNEPGWGPSAQAIRNGSVVQTWTGGVGGYVSWKYYAPGKPTLKTATRSSDGTSLTITVNSGTGQVDGNYVNLDAYTWHGNGTAFAVGAHQTVTMYGLSNNSDANSGWANLGSSYGIPKAPINFTVTPSSTVSGRITGSWGAPDYVGQSLNKYVVKRTDTVTSEVTTIIDSNTTSFTDDNLIRGRLYSYEVYIIGNSSPGNGLSSVKTNIMAPGVPSQPVPYTLQAPLSLVKVGRNVTVSCQEALSGYGNSITKYYVDYSLDGVNWSSKIEMTNRSYTYNLLPPAKTYIFRCVAYNSIGYGDYTISPGLFVPAGGKRLRTTGEDFAGTYQPTNIARRYDTTLIPPRWVDINIAKRFSQSANNGNGAWIELT